MSHSMKVVGQSQKAMYGPRGILVCGFMANERKNILKIFSDKTFKNLPVIFTSESDRTSIMKKMLARPHQHGMEGECRLDCAIIMSGLTEKELHQIMGAYKMTHLQKPLWATLTPTSENWTVEALILELKKDRLHIEK